MNLTFKSPKYFDNLGKNIQLINLDNIKQDLDTLINYVKTNNIGRWSDIETTLSNNRTITSYNVKESLKRINKKIDTIEFFSVDNEDGLIDVYIDFENGTRTNIRIYKLGE